MPAAARGGPRRRQDRPGALFHYRPNGPWLWRRAGWHAAQVLKEARPAALPVQQPSVFELVLNLKIALALGISSPPAIRRRADRLIQERADAPGRGTEDRLEIETSTWDGLPESLKTGDLVDYVCRELEWVRGQLA